MPKYRIILTVMQILISSAKQSPIKSKIKPKIFVDLLSKLPKVAAEDGTALEGLMASLEFLLVAPRTTGG